MNPSKTKNRS